MFATLRRLSENQEFSGFIDGILSENDDLDASVQGVLLGFDRYWLRWWESHWWTFGPPHAPRPHLWHPNWRPLLDPFELPVGQPPDWGGHLRRMGRTSESGSPIEITFSLVPGTKVINSNWPTSWRGFGIRYEVRPRCVALGLRDPVDPVEGGVSVGRQNETGSGTLGGLLRDPRTLTKYIVSCAHVFGAQGNIVQPAEDDHRRSRFVATVSSSRMPPPRQPGLRRSASPSDTIDAALAPLAPASDGYLRIDRVGAIDRVEAADDIDSFENVTFVGKQSGSVQAETKQLAHWYEVDIDQKPRLFRDVFTIGFRQHQYLVTSLAQKGDSGAWIVCTDNGLTGWCGVLFAGDGLEAFCCFSEHVHAALGPQLVVR